MPGAVARIASYTSYIAVYFLPGCQARLMASVQTKLTNRPISLRLVPPPNADAIAVLVLARRDQAGPTEKRDQISKSTWRRDECDTIKQTCWGDDRGSQDISLSGCSAMSFWNEFTQQSFLAQHVAAL